MQIRIQSQGYDAHRQNFTAVKTSDFFLVRIRLQIQPTKINADPEQLCFQAQSG